MRSNCSHLIDTPSPHGALLIAKQYSATLVSVLPIGRDVDLNPGPILEHKVNMILDGQKEQTKVLKDIKRDQRSLQKCVNEDAKRVKKLAKNRRGCSNVTELE